ncbi:hypothetical protein HRI_001114900 [Hibiscus trionum]|uniref:RING-type domain-containing protein n=1 Tax=Hibiscus trionum TaxID=183268 RepID=A0A9W7HCA5_HIBTR|nr:hypothetical protein HRI_001114900 [Hibiscus trionum]
MALQAQLHADNIGLPIPLCGSLDCGGAGTGAGLGGFNQFCFRQPHQQQLQIQQLNNQNNCFETMASSQDEKQRYEIDQFMKSQNERLRLLLQEQRNQLVAAMVKKLESKATLLLKQKDEELAKARNKTMELQNLVNKLEMENQAWQRVVQENEATVVSLNNALEQLQQQQNQAGCCFDNGVGDAESCCEETEEENNRGFVETTTMVVCKCCNSRGSCVLFIPCRHLCSCKDCAAFLDSCPVCSTAKKASIEALIS